MNAAAKAAYCTLDAGSAGVSVASDGVPTPLVGPVAAEIALARDAAA